MIRTSKLVVGMSKFFAALLIMFEHNNFDSSTKNYFQIYLAKFFNPQQNCSFTNMQMKIHSHN